jgi:fumarylacetoacetase
MRTDLPLRTDYRGDFTPANLPFGIFSTAGTPPRAGIAIQDWVIDLPALAATGCFDFDVGVLSRPVLNEFIALGKQTTSRARTQVQAWIQNEGDSPLTTSHLLPLDEVRLHLPIHIGDYTDFYSSMEHATNVGKLFRDPENALLPNWRHLPVGYHGRASSIVVSGTNIRRPRGQILRPGTDTPVFAATERLDFELEMAFVVGKDSEPGRPVPMEQAEEYIFGLLLLNDWSARDIQKWEYVPLGPFLGKSFASSVSPWVVTLDALEPFRLPGPVQQPEPLGYLRTRAPAHFAIDLTVTHNGRTISRSSTKHLYWSMAQQLAHHTSNGCNLRVGDLMASGTISGPDENSYGSLLELTRNGTTGDFLHDGDTVTLAAHAGKGHRRVGFGGVGGTILPSD